MSLADLRNPSSPGYKKARRQHQRTTRNRDNTVDLGWTPFRAAEKRYKTRFPPPDLSDVLDLATLVEVRASEMAEGGWCGRPDAFECRELTPKDHTNSKVYAIPHIPGLVLLPSFVSPTEQKYFVRWSLSDQARYPNETNLDTHYILPEDGLWNVYLNSRLERCTESLVHPRVLSMHPPSTVGALSEQPGPRQLIDNTPTAPDNILTLSSCSKDPATPSPTVLASTSSTLLPKLRWANIGWTYHWGSKQYDFQKGRGEVHPRVRELCKRAVGVVDWGQVFGPGDASEGWGECGPDWMTWDNTYEPDAGIVNFYQSKDTLMGHADRSEVCATSPLVSISLGNAAIFLIGGVTRDVEPVAILLRSGDAVIMSGPTCRRAYHGVPRVLENTLPSHFEDSDDAEWELYKEYLRTARINVNVRQVFPKGFDPDLVMREG